LNCTMSLSGIIQVGLIVNSHGLKGEMKVLPQTDDPEIFHRLEELICLQGNERTIRPLTAAREAKNHWLIKLEGVKDIDAAKLLKGEALYTTEDQIRPLGEDEFFIHDLINAKVYSTDDCYLGTIFNYFEAGSQGVCEVQSEAGDFLFPASQEVMKEIKPNGDVIIQLIPELITLNRKKAK
jgi:16S rRNA processing protein RimM